MRESVRESVKFISQVVAAVVLSIIGINVISYFAAPTFAVSPTDLQTQVDWITRSQQDIGAGLNSIARRQAALDAAAAGTPIGPGTSFDSSPGVTPSDAPVPSDDSATGNAVVYSSAPPKSALSMPFEQRLKDASLVRKGLLVLVVLGLIAAAVGYRKEGQASAREREEDDQFRNALRSMLNGQSIRTSEEAMRLKWGLVAAAPRARHGYFAGCLHEEITNALPDCVSGVSLKHDQEVTVQATSRDAKQTILAWLMNGHLPFNTLARGDDIVVNADRSDSLLIRVVV